MSGKREREDDAGGASKKARWVDENDIDWLIGDLTREEAQLVLTRLIRRAPEIETAVTDLVHHVRHSRAGLSSEQLNSQIQQLQQLMQLRTAVLSGPIPPSSTGGALFPMAFGPGGAAPMAGADGGKVARSNTQAAFRKVKGLAQGVNRYRVDMAMIDKEAASARALVIDGNCRGALTILEAVCEEFLSKCDEVGSKAVDNYDDVFQLLATDLMRVFLARNSDLDTEERQEWVSQLRQWDTSADETGVLAPARHAARTDWTDAALTSILEGSAEGESPPYSEHVDTTLARLNVLETEKKYDQALNLATHADLSGHRCRFLVRLGKVDEAVNEGMAMDDPAQIFTTAQLLRSHDTSASIRMVVRSLIVGPPEFGDKTETRVAWLCDLAIAENCIDKAVEAVMGVRSKVILGGMCRTLAAKPNLTDVALKMAARVLQPYSNEQLREQFAEAAQKRLMDLPAALQATTRADAIPPTRSGLLAAMPHSAVPSDLASWMWNIAVTNNLTETEELLSTILDACDDPHALRLLMQETVETCDHHSLVRAGEAALKLINRHEASELQYLKMVAQEKYHFKKRPIPVGESQPVYTAPDRDHPHYDYTKNRALVCDKMTAAILDEKSVCVALVEPKNDDGMKVDEGADDSKANLDRMLKIDAVLDRVTDIILDHSADPAVYIQFLSRMTTKGEYRRAIKCASKAYALISGLEKARSQRATGEAQLQDLQDEVKALVSAGLPVPEETSAKLTALELEEAAVRVLPPYQVYSEVKYAGLVTEVVVALLKAITKSRAESRKVLRLQPEEEQGAVDEAIHVLSDPCCMLRVLRTCNDLSEYDLANRLGKEVMSRFEERCTSAQKWREKKSRFCTLQALQKSHVSLTDDEKTEATRLRRELERGPDMLVWQYVDSSASRIVEEVYTKMFIMAVRRQREATNRLDNPLPTDTDDTRAALAGDRDKGVAAFKDALDMCATRVTNPDSLARLASSLAYLGEATGCLRLCSLVDEPTQKRIEVVRARIENDVDLAEMQRQATISEEAPADLVRFRMLVSERENRNAGSDYGMMGLVELGQLRQQAIITGLEALQSRKRLLQTTIDDDLSDIAKIATMAVVNLTNKDVAASVGAKAVADAQEKRAELQSEIESIDDMIDAVYTQHSLSTQDPAILHAIAHNCAGDMSCSSRPNKLVQLITSMFTLYQARDQIRRDRIPELEEMHLLKEESKELQAVKKTLDEDKEKRLKELERNDRILKCLPKEEQLTSDQLEKEYFAAASLLLKTLNDREDALRSQLGAQLASLAKMDTSAPMEVDDGWVMADAPGFDSPDKINTLLQTLDLSDETSKERSLKSSEVTSIEKQLESLTAALKLGIELVRDNIQDPAAIDQVVSLEEGYSARREAQDELDELVAEKQDLKAVLKTLPSDKAERLAELAHTMFLFNQEAAYNKADLSSCDKYRRECALGRVQGVRKRLVGLRKEAESIDAAAQVAMNTATKDSTPGEIRSSQGRTRAEVDALIEECRQLAHKCLERALSQDVVLPLDQLKIAKTLSGHKEWALTVEAARTSLSSLAKAEKTRLKCAREERTLYVHLNRHAELMSKRKTIPDGLLSEIEAARKRVEALPELSHVFTDARSDLEEQVAAGMNADRKEADVTDESAIYDTTDFQDGMDTSTKLLISAALALVSEHDSSVLESKQAGDVREKAADEAKRAELEKLLEDCVDLILKKVSDPAILHTALKAASKVEGRTALVLQLSEHALQGFSKARDAALDRDAVERELDGLSAEEESYVVKRKDLPAETEARLLELRLNFAQGEVLPDYRCGWSVANVDSHALETCKVLLDSIAESRNAARGKVDMALANPALVRADSSLGDDAVVKGVQDALTLADGHYDRGIELIVANVGDLVSLSHVSKRLFKDREFQRMIPVGESVQDKLTKELALREQYEALKMKLAAEEHALLGIDPSKEILDMQAELKELEWQVPRPIPQLRKMICEEADRLIDGARMVDRGDVVTTQAILVFRTTLTFDKFDEVRTLTDAAKWPDVRESLLAHAAAHDTTLPGSPVTARELIDLLLREQQWDAAIKALPAPVEDFRKATSHRRAKNLEHVDDNIDTLELLYSEIEKNQPQLLDRLLPPIEAFARREFNQWNTKSMDRLLDAVQVKHPDFVIELYEIGTDTFLANLSPSQYDELIGYLRVLRRRLVVDLKMDGKWNTFMGALRKEHARKKKLIQHFNVHFPL